MPAERPSIACMPRFIPTRRVPTRRGNMIRNPLSWWMALMATMPVVTVLGSIATGIPSARIPAACAAAIWITIAIVTGTAKQKGKH